MCAAVLPFRLPDSRPRRPGSTGANEKGDSLSCGERGMSAGHEDAPSQSRDESVLETWSRDAKLPAPRSVYTFHCIGALTYCVPVSSHPPASSLPVRKSESGFQKHVTSRATFFLVFL